MPVFFWVNAGCTIVSKRNSTPAFMELQSRRDRLWDKYKKYYKVKECVMRSQARDVKKIPGGRPVITEPVLCLQDLKPGTP